MPLFVPLLAIPAMTKATQLADFDLIVKDALMWPGAVLAEVLKIPAVNILPIPLFQPVGYHFLGTPNPIAYVEQSLWGNVPQVQPGVLP